MFVEAVVLRLIQIGCEIDLELGRCFGGEELRTETLAFGLCECLVEEQLRKWLLSLGRSELVVVLPAEFDDDPRALRCRRRLWNRRTHHSGHRASSSRE